jgi:hypothetical protein
MTSVAYDCSVAKFDSHILASPYHIDGDIILGRASKENREHQHGQWVMATTSNSSFHEKMMLELEVRIEDDVLEIFQGSGHLD